MKRRKTTLIPHADGLERREVLSAAHPVAPHIANAVSDGNIHSGVFIDYSIPYLIAHHGLRQNAINFTSNTFHEILNGLDSAAKSFAQHGSSIHLERNLSSLAHRVPYGGEYLLPIWLDDVSNPELGPGSALQQTKLDLIDFVNGGVGYDFNVLKSGTNWSSDGHLIYNGRVGQSPPHFQQLVPVDFNADGGGG
jgi:hypothetical protein